VLRALQRGQPGDPIVDADMHQLRYITVMHNRVCMMVSLLLVEHLLID
jgi:deoxyribodipyrimidine photolyase